MKFSKIKIQFLILCLGLIVPLNIAISQNFETGIDSLLADKMIADEPGGVFLVAKGDKVLYRKAFGFSNLELETAMIPENIFEIGSITKQFTAVSILMLMEQGKLTLKDEITKYLPNYPTHGHKITIHHLLNHTSGIKSYTGMKGLRDISRTDLSPLELIDFFKDEPMDFEPGEKYKYNNSAYVILGYIIEKISGITYEEFLVSNIFSKIGLNATHYGNYTKIIKNRASGYHKRPDFINKQYISQTLPYAGGSLMSNVDDMLLWNSAVQSYDLLKKETTGLAFTNYNLNNGDSINYGYGWAVKKINDVTSIEHGGSIFGFKSMGVYVPSHDIYVIGLSNCDCNSPTQITRDIAAFVMRKH